MKPLSQGTYMPNMKALSKTVQKLSEMVQKLWPMLIFFFKVGHRFKVTGQNFLYEYEALVTKNLHTKYEGSIWYRLKSYDQC